MRWISWKGKTAVKTSDQLWFNVDEKIWDHKILKTSKFRQKNFLQILGIKWTVRNHQDGKSQPHAQESPDRIGSKSETREPPEKMRPETEKFRCYSGYNFGFHSRKASWSFSNLATDYWNTIPSVVHKQAYYTSRAAA